VCGLPAESIASVVSLGSTGSTVKHSVGRLSSEVGTSPSVNTARQQYFPTEVTVTSGEVTVLAALLTSLAGPILVPTFVFPSQVWLSSPLGIGPHSSNCTVPLQVLVPLTVTLASSLTPTVPSPIDSGPEISLPPESSGVVFVSDPQFWNCPNARSLSCACSE